MGPNPSFRDIKGCCQAHRHRWTLTETPLGYHTVAPSHGHPMIIFLQDQFLQVLQQIRESLDVRVGQPKSRKQVWVEAELVCPSHWDSPLGQGRAEPDLANPCHLGQLFHAHGKSGDIYPKCGVGGEASDMKSKALPLVRAI